jgi:predicted Fe-Mo cluster-binding NifX family protein
MKIAIPTNGTILDEYFDFCEVFTIFTIDDKNNIIDTEILYTPQGCDCKNNVPSILQEKGVTIVLAGKLPEHADGVCEKFGIKPFLGYSGVVHEVVNAFLQKEL